MTKQLTKEMLEEMGVTITINEDGNYVVKRMAVKAGMSKKPIEKTYKRVKMIRKHKYAPDKVYVGYAWSYKNKPFMVTESRLVYAYFIGDIPDNYDIDHIDNDPFNNKLNNLRLLTREENLKKRFLDNADNCKNQWDYIKKHKDD